MDAHTPEPQATDTPLPTEGDIHLYTNDAALQATSEQALHGYISPLGGVGSDLGFNNLLGRLSSLMSTFEISATAAAPLSFCH